MPVVRWSTVIVLILAIMLPGGLGDVVRIDAIVTDRHGQPVEGLRLADFELRDRGVSRSLEAVEFFTSPRVRQPSEFPIVTEDDERRGASEPGTRVFAFFVDEFHLSAESAARAVAIVDAFIDDKVHAHDLAAVIRPADAIPSLRFTRDHARLHGVLASVSGRQDEVAPHLEEIVAAKLRELAMRFGRMEAHRPILVLISEGFSDRAADLDHVVRASSLYHFPIYTFNPADHKGGEAMLRRLAEQTGGLFIDVDSSIAGFARIAHDTEAYYSLRYRAASGEDDMLHAIEVRVKREASIRTRTVYWPDAAGEKSALAALPPASVAIPQRPLRRSPLVDVWVGIRPASEGTSQSQMTVTWEPRSGHAQTARSVRLEAKTQDPTGSVLFDGPIASASAARFVAPSGLVELDLAIRDDTNQVIDTDVRDVDVPNWRSTTTTTSGPRLVPIEIIRARSPRDARRTDDPDPAPTASRTFMRTNVLLIRAPAYDPSGVAVQVNVHLLNVAGRLLSDIPQAAEGAEGFVLPLASLAPGVYQLEVIASNPNGRAALRVEFRVTD